MIDTFKLVGALGLVFITAGVLSKQRKRQDILYILGGVLLLAYSTHLGDPIFMTLQTIFTIAAAVDYLKLKR